MVLMLDSMWSYSYEDALRVGWRSRRWATTGTRIRWPRTTSTATSSCTQKLDIPIMATEHAPGGFYGYDAWITEQATDILRGDVAVKGGITPMVKICHLAEGFGMKCEIHHGGNSLNNVANLHVTMAIRTASTSRCCCLTRRRSTASSRTSKSTTAGSTRPTEPGLGYEIDWDRLRREHTGTLA